MSALFRLAEPEGVIKIDGIFVTEIGLHSLRNKLSIIPQVTAFRNFSREPGFSNYCCDIMLNCLLILQ